MNISALILTKNEQNLISDCIKQLDFVDEILVLDQNSNDRTVDIAKKLGAKIIENSKGRFDIDRNLLKESSNNQWLLYIDADERLSSELKQEIKLLINQNHSAYYFPRQNIILGKWLKHGGWWPDYVPRLFKKKDLIGWVGAVHESPKIEGTIGYAQNPIKHLTGQSISKMLAKSTKWAKIEAQLYADSKAAKVTKLKVIKASLQEFTRRYFLKLGLLDGYVGLIESIFQALHSSIVLIYLWEIQNNTKVKFSTFKNE